MMHVIVVGGGPAGLMAADVVSAHGVRVTLYEQMPNVGRKLLMAGRGGLNLTHSEPRDAFLSRFGAALGFMQPLIETFPPDALRTMAGALGQETFVGSSGRVFPTAMKASPLLRAWLARLASQGVEIRTRHRFAGFDADGRPRITGPQAAQPVSPDAPKLPDVPATPDAIVLALGGASWPRLGSDAAWVPELSGVGIRVVPFVSANAGLRVAWSAHFRDRFAGEPLKRIAITAGGSSMRGEAIVTRDGLEGGVIYALTPVVRDLLGQGEGQAEGQEAVLSLDLRPDLALPDLAARLSRPRGKQSVAGWLRKSARLAPVAIGLLREANGTTLPDDPGKLAEAIKGVRLRATATAPIARAISSAGGVALDEVGQDLMVKSRPGLFLAGEMLDWEAPTGGYLLQGCFATGYAAGHGVLRYLGVVPARLACEGDVPGASVQMRT